MEFTIEQLNATITAITRAQARATKEIGNAILMCLYFANVKGDPGAANALINCLRKSTKQAGIVKLLETHGNLAWSTIGKKKAEFALFDAGHKAEDWTPENVKELRTICAGWESFKPETEKADELDLVEAINRLIKKADSAKEKKITVRGEALVSALNKLVAAYTAKEMDAMLG